MVWTGVGVWFPCPDAGPGGAVVVVCVSVSERSPVVLVAGGASPWVGVRSVASVRRVYGAGVSVLGVRGGLWCARVGPGGCRGRRV